MIDQEQPPAEYRCPGASYAISRAVHLGRLARFYPGCRQCPHRDDTGTLSTRQVQRLAETRVRGQQRPLFHEEGAGGVCRGDLGPAAARDVAAALGVLLLRGGTGECHCFDRSSAATSIEKRSSRTSSGARAPVVVLAGDGRPLSAEFVPAVCEGLRWSGCHVIDIGAASAACLAFAIDHLQATGGIMVGNPSAGPHTVGLKFFAPGPQPLSEGGSLEPLRELYQTGFDRPTRAYGSLRRFQADVPYLTGLAPYYHALRPLRFVLDSACTAMVRYLQELSKAVACQVIDCGTTRGELPQRLLAEGAHFAAGVDDDGETCHVFDDQGRAVANERLLLLLARHLLPQAVVLEHGTESWVATRIEAMGGRVVFSGARRAEMAAAMRKHGAVLGGGPGARFWYAAGGLPLPDALMTLTMLLVVLSRSDRRFSEVLDRQAAAG